VPRKARLDAPETLHHVIVRGIERRQIVDDDRDRRDFVSRMVTVAVESASSIYAWALMTSHAHILLRSLVFLLISLLCYEEVIFLQGDNTFSFYHPWRYNY